MCSIVLDLFLDFQNVFIYAKGERIQVMLHCRLRIKCLLWVWLVVESWSDVLMGECFDKRL